MHMLSFDLSTNPNTLISNEQNITDEEVFPVSEDTEGDKTGSERASSAALRQRSAPLNGKTASGKSITSVEPDIRVEIKSLCSRKIGEVQVL